MRSIKQLKDGSLLTSNSMFASNVQDGNFKVLDPSSLSQASKEKQFDFGITEPSNEVTEQFSVDCEYAITDAECV